MPESIRPLGRGVIRLPGGSEVVIDDAPLRQLCRNAFQNLGAAGLMFLDKVEDLFPFLRVVPARSAVSDADRRSWMVSEVLDRRASWSSAEVESLREALRTGPIAAALQHELDRIVFVRGLLTDRAIMEPLPRQRFPLS
jgi:hypothetical protein